MAPHLIPGNAMHPGRRAQKGVTYLWMLFLVFLISLGLGKSLEVYSTQIQREQEAELLYVGGLYREAIKIYYQSSPGSVKTYPEKLENLLRDPRHLTTRRYIRKLYPDPLTGMPFNVVLAAEGGIKGVRSTSIKTPVKVAGFANFIEITAPARSYSDWVFLYDGEWR